MTKRLILIFTLLSGINGFLRGQNLEIVLDSTFTSLRIGQAFEVTGRVQNVGPAIPSGQTIKATVEFVAPDGTAVATHIQTWNGFPEPNNPGTLRNDASNTRVIFQFPWTHSDQDLSGWSIRANVEGFSLETDLSDNTFIHDGFTMELPDLIIESSFVSSNNAGNVFLPDSVINASGRVRNVGQVRTEEGVLFPVVARLYRGSQAAPANLVETERRIIPSPRPGGLPFLESQQDVDFEFDDIHLPAGTNPGDNFFLTVSVDPTDIALGSIIDEMNENNALQQSEHQILIDGGDINSSARARLTVDSNSFSGDTGSFRGLDPIRMSFSVKNEGQVAVQTNDQFAVDVLLSSDIQRDDTDFILRNFDIGGRALGADLGPDQTLTLDWIQQLPDNFEGDFYLLIDINGNVTPLESTPSITLETKFGGTTSLLEGDNVGQFAGGERPHASVDGRYVVYEKTVNNIQQIFFKDTLSEDEPTLITAGYIITDNFGNGGSFRPKISGDGSTVTFYSKASNLVPGDLNNHTDIFIYKVRTGETKKAYNFSSFEEADGSSFYPDINYDGTKVVFESSASNLNSDGAVTNGKQIFLWNLENGGTGTIQALTSGNQPSSTPSIDNVGNAVAFASEATNLVSGDTNGVSDIFLHYIDTNVTFRANLAIGAGGVTQALGGLSDQPAISGDGSSIVYRSFATNLVTEKGISGFSVTRSGVGYFGEPSIVVTDNGSTGSGAILRFNSEGVDVYGQILQEGIEIVSHGENYTDPIITIIPDPTQPSPVETAQVEAFLSHPRGEIYHVATSDVSNQSSGGNLYSKRISENDLGVGGNFESREPSISDDGNIIVYSTRSSNLLDGNVTRSDGSVFYNSPTRIARANAILVGGIGEIEVTNAGSGYQNGFLLINDTSGNGSGAVASYQVDAFGRVASIEIINEGSNYRLETTEVSVDNPRGGNGFVAGSLRFSQGSQIQRVEMLDNGSGYKEISYTQGVSGLITIDGDGVDADGNGRPDARINTERIFIDMEETGGIYIEQIIDLELLSTNSLLNTILTFSDYQQTVTLDFAQSSTSLNTIGIFGKSLAEIAEEIKDKLDDFWDDPSTSDRFEGPKITYFPGSTNITFAALSGEVTSDNPTATSVTYESNMLIGGSGYTRAVPVIAPSPVIYGFSEIQTSFDSQNNTNPEDLLNPTSDFQTDDIYLHTLSDGKNTRVSKSSFGSPMNYLSSSSNQPISLSNRFPSISGNGRHVLYSSDAEDSWGLIFDGSNQSSADDNGLRDIYVFDRKTNAIQIQIGEVEILFPKENQATKFSSRSKIPLVVDFKITPEKSGLVYGIVFVNGTQQDGVMEQHGVTNSAVPSYSDYLSHRFGYSIPSSATRFGSNTIQVAFVDPATGNQVSISDRLVIEVNPPSEWQQSVELLELPFTTATDTSKIIVAARPTSDGIEIPLEGLQYYLNGEPYGEKVFRTPGIDLSKQIFQIFIEPDNVGVYSVHAIFSDKNGNYVAADNIRHFSVTKGTLPGEVSFANEFSNYDLKHDEKDFLIDLNPNNGSVLKITLINAPNQKFTGAPKAILLGSGSGAILETEIDENGFLKSIHVKDGGLGYSQIEPLSIKIIPIRRVIRSGIPAQIFTTWYDNVWDIWAEEEVIVSQLNSISNNISIVNQIVSENMDSNASLFTPSPYAQYGWLSGFETFFGIRKRFDGTPEQGEGYVVAPRVFPVLEFGEGAETYTLDRLPLAPAPFGTSHVQDFSLQKDGVYYPMQISGGFTRAPIYINAFPSQTSENIKSVHLSVNGLVESSVTAPPYLFEWVASEPIDYSISVIVKDYDGNIVYSTPTFLSVDEFSGSGLIAKFDGGIDSNVFQAGSQAMFSILASSEFGIRDVEIYLNGSSVGYATPNGDGRYSIILDFDGFEQGSNLLSFVARDKAGNESGTHDPSVTNIQEYKHKEIVIVASSEQSAPTVTPYPLPNEFDSNETFLRFKLGETATINLQATADQDGQVDKIYLMANGRTLQNISGEFFVQHDSNSSLHTNGIYPFQFIPQNIGTFNIISSVVDSFGGQSFSKSKVTMEVVKNSSLSPEVTMIFPENDIQISSTSEIRLVSTAVDPDDSLEGVQYYVNGKEYGEFIFYDKSSPMANSVFGINWSPEKVPGSYYISVKAKDSSGNETYSPAVVVNAAQGNELVPQLSLSPISPFYTTGSDVSILVAVTDEADSATGFGYIEEVRYFINGLQQGDPDTQFPYYHNWVPMEKGSYEVHVQARDNEGNYRISEVVSVEVSDAEQVTLTLSPIGSGNSGDGISDGTKVSIPVIATGTHGGLENLGQVTLQVNGEFYGSSPGVRNMLPSGLIGSITYNFEWLANYDEYSSSNGAVNFAATGGNPQISSNIESVNIPKPIPWVDEESAAGSIFSDITGDGASLQELNEFSRISSSSEEDFATKFINWVGASSSSIISDRIDIIAAHHIAFGVLHSNYAKLMEDFSRIGVGNTWLKDYINSILTSPEYLGKFNSVPYLVGSYGSSNIENFEANRMDFVNRCFRNKYGQDPTNAQAFQGSRRMLFFWESFEQDYWEILGIVPLVSQLKDSPPRRDTVEPNNYDAGECAVDFVYNLARELPFEAGFPYIQSTSGIRDSYYMNALLLFSIFKTSVAAFTEDEMNQILQLNSAEALNSIISDYRYTSRFNYLWINSPGLENTDLTLSHWKQEEWFGAFMDKYYPWIYHSSLGWVYTPQGDQKYNPDSNLNGFWAYSDNVGWWWTFDEAFRLSLYSGYVYLQEFGQWADLDASNGRINRYRLWNNGIAGSWTNLSN